MPAAVEFSVGQNRESMRVAFTKSLPTVPADQASVKDIQARFSPVKARFIRIRAKTVGTCPSWHVGAGGKAWIFIDEVMAQ